MTRGYTHAKATHHPGPVCGADDGPVTRVSEDPLQIDCPDCPDLVWIEELPNDATAGDPRNIEVLRDITRGYMRKIDGVIVDGTTAAAILTVYDVMKPPTRATFLALDIDKMATVAWRLLRPHT
ncbi:hypothetical protein [Salinispora pacifica]|uniref:hypothetical protein n=1 Tax=Salinispora pacifica TaxID=351187 RepID=UPI0004887E00|nr:hypothetical protein [Salinispora pacifica]